jgi:hypothetical protein
VTYRLKNPNVEAYHLPPDDEMTRQLPPSWLVEALMKREALPQIDGRLLLTNSDESVSPGDWVVQRPNGTLSGMSDRLFREVYEAVPEVTKP